MRRAACRKATRMRANSSPTLKGLVRFHTQRQPLRVQCFSQPRTASNQLVLPVAGVDAYKHAMGGRPRTNDAAAAHLTAHVGVNAVGRLTQCQVAQGQQIPISKKTIKRTGSLCKDIVQTFNMLHIEGAVDIDAGAEQHMEILPSFGVPTAWRVRVGQFIHQQQCGMPLHRGINASCRRCFEHAERFADGGRRPEEKLEAAAHPRKKDVGIRPAATIRHTVRRRN